MPRPVSTDRFEDAVNGYITPREDNFMSGASPLESGRRPEKRFTGHGGGNNNNMHQTPSPTSLARMLSNAKKHRAGKKVSLRDRICCHQWNWFTMTMATGGIANVLHTVPYKSQWLYIVGVIFMLFNVFLFATNCGLIAMRFALSPPGSFIQSFTDQMECLFIPSIVVSTAIILINFSQYGFSETGPWLQRAIEVLYWIYIPFSVIASCGMYLILWSTQIFPIHTMTPAWVFPAYPLLLGATFAGNIISNLDPSSPVIARRLAIALAGLTTQGTGFLISLLISAAFMYRLMTQKLPRDTQRPGVFISIGPPGFTCGGVLMLGSNVNQILPEDIEGRVYAQYSLKFMSIVMGLWFWGLTIWFFIVSVGSLHKYVRKGYAMPFQMNWWSFVFPNTAMVSATFALAKALDNDALRIVGCVKTGILVLVWLGVFVRMLKGLWDRDIMFPKDPEND